jgi:hypothetical protein
MGLPIASLLVLVLAFSWSSLAQDLPKSPPASPGKSTLLFPALQTHMPTKHGNVPQLHPEEVSPSPQTKIQLDPVQLRREGLELQELSQSLQLDIESVNQGILPKDLSAKLKRIEKLAKHLRGEITP